MKWTDLVGLICGRLGHSMSYCELAMSQYTGVTDNHDISKSKYW